MDKHPVSELLTRFWWLILLRGICAILFGIVAIAWPGQTLTTLAMFFAAYVFVDGVFSVIHAVGHRKELEHWGLLLLEGLFGVAFGVIAFQSPEFTTAVGGLVVAFYIAAWAIVTGALRIAMAVRLRKEIEGEWLLILSGAISVLFGIAVMARPSAALVSMLYLVAIWAILLGISLIVVAIKARLFANRVRELVGAVKERREAIG